VTILRPKIILLVAGAITFLILISIAQEMNRRWQYQAEVDKLEESVKKMEKDVTALENLNHYFRTEDYQERLAREKLNYRAPGEKVVLIPSDSTVTSAATEPLPDTVETLSIPRRWWKIFFEDQLISG
jgi:cell division protein FtsB